MRLSCGKGSHVYSSHPNTIYARINKMGLTLEEAVRYG